MTMPTQFGEPTSRYPEPPAAPPQQPPVSLTINTPPTPPPANGVIYPELQAIFDAELTRRIEAVRTEEKNKLYPQIDELKGQLTVLASEREERIAAQQQAEQEAAEAERLRQEAEMSALEKINASQAEMQHKLAEMEAERERERLIFAKEQEFRALEDYKARLRIEHADNIVPQLLDFISGTTKEQVDASVQDLISRSEAMAQEIAAQFGQQQPPPRLPSMPVTGGPPVDMARMGEEGTRTFTNADLQAMSPAEYEQNRPALLDAMRRQINERGIYG